MLARCLKCRKVFAMKRKEKKLVRQEEINILEQLTQPHPRGEIQKMVERFVLGERKVYEITSVCRFCGDVRVKTVYEDTKQDKSNTRKTQNNIN